jgi:signal transduction histidine kinase
MKTSADIDYRNLFANLPGLYLVLLPDTGFTIVAASESYTKATMTEFKDMEGKGLFEVFPDNPDDPDADGVSNLRYSLRTVVKTKKVHSMPVQKYDIRRQDGTFEIRYWSPLNKPVLDDEGNLKLIIHRVEDVTEYMIIRQEHEARTQLTNELREKLGQMESEIFNRSNEVKQKNEELTEANQNMESFTYSVSHDLRTPLRAIDGYCLILEEDYKSFLDAEGKRLLGNVRNNAKRMGALIDELLEFSKLGKREVHKSMVNMKDLAEHVSEELTLNPQGSEGIVIGNLHPAEADYGLIKQVMMNLLSNAIKYSSHSLPPRIQVSSQEQDREIVYSVTDNGVGFDMAYADKLFGVFQRLHNYDEFEGTGVGLAIVRKIINKHGGAIWANAKPGEGATFSFTLPMA